MSLYAELGGGSVIEARLVVPKLGAWFADVTLATEVTLSGSLVLTIANLAWTCSVWAGGPYQGRTHVRVIGGMGGWQKSLKVQAYANPNGVMLSTLLKDAASAVGESVSLTDPDVAVGRFYVRELASAERILNRLATQWHIGPDGSTVVGPWPDSSAFASAFDVVDYDPKQRHSTIATEDLAGVTPGRTITKPQLGGAVLTVSSVVHTLTAKGVRTEVLAA